MAIKAPYNFAPISGSVFYPKWAKDISQDIPFEDGEDAVIELKITNLTPLFVGSSVADDGDTRYSAHVKTSDGQKHYFIPGTTLKGCFRSAMETLAFAKLTQYNNASFGMTRVFDTKKTTNNSYKEAMKNVFCGWLEQRFDGGKIEYVITPCEEGVRIISHKDILKRFPNFKEGEDHKTAEMKQLSLVGPSDPYPLITIGDDEIFYLVNQEKKSVPEGRYRIVCTGYMGGDPGKTHEYLFSNDHEQEMPVSKEVFETFDTVHKRTEYYGGREKEDGYLKKRLKNGEPIPVFFTKDAKGVTAIGITRMFRYPFPYDINYAVANSYAQPVRENDMDLPEAIFGYIRKDGSEQMKGRVAIGHAFCQKTVADGDLVFKQGVLGQPSASYYPLYLVQNGTKYVSWNDSNIRIAGRKRYRIAKNNTKLQLPRNEKNAKVETSFLALPAGNTFTCSIAVHNLRKAEIGALLSSITMNKTPGTFHNIGLARSFGLGKICCEVELKGFKYSVEDYLREFEFELLNAGMPIFNNLSLDQLAAIASEHDDATMQMMNLDEYGEASNGFSVLAEENKKMSHFVTTTDWNEEKKRREKAAEDAERRKLEQEKLTRLYKEIDDGISGAIDLKEKGLYPDAKTQLERIQSQAIEMQYKVKEINNLLVECKSILDQAGKEPLDKYLQNKATSIGSLLKNTEKWVASGNEISDVELGVLCELFKGLPKKELRNLMKKKGDFIKALGLDNAERLLAMLGIH